MMLFETQENWEAWLKEHHTDIKGIWLKMAKKQRAYLLYNIQKPWIVPYVMAGSMVKKPLSMTSIGYKNSRHAAQRVYGQKSIATKQWCLLLKAECS